MYFTKEGLSHFIGQIIQDESKAENLVSNSLIGKVTSLYYLKKFMFDVKKFPGAVW